MSMLGFKKHIEDGDLVIVFIGHESMVAVTIKKGDITQTRYGAMRHNDVLGKEFGSKIQTVNQRGYVFVLHPSPELWTVNLPHRTQILYFADISMITMQLDLKPGSVVVESGTGSGSMSHAIARTIAPSGHLYTFEFHEQRTQLAAAEFKKHGLGEVVTVEHRDVCEKGFGLELKVDAVFLDLPGPHLAVPHAKKILKSGGRICSFSPCIEQVQVTCQEFDAQGFSDMTTMEVLLRNYDTRTIGFPVPNLGLEVTQTDDVSTQKSDQNDSVTKPKLEQDSGTPPANEQDSGTPSANDAKAEAPKDDGASGKRSDRDSEAPSGDAKRFRKDNERRPRKAKATLAQYSVKCAVPNKETAGHTGYLTFATLFNGED